MTESCEIVVCNGQDYTLSEETANMHGTIAGILLDVPCSATGTGRRRPDVMRKDCDDMNDLLDIQRRLSDHCVDNLLDIGGVLVYATCSILKKESEEQVSRLLSRGCISSNGDNIPLNTLPFSPGEIPGFDKAIDENGWLRIMPGEYSIMK